MLMMVAMTSTFAPPSTPVQPPPEPERSARSNRPVAAWLAIAGSGLILIAAIVVVASQWRQIPQSMRFSGLLTAVVLIASLAERIRMVAPTTAVVIAHLVPAMAATVGIAAGSTFDLRWPGCIAIGGILAGVVTEVQKRRWASPRMAVVAAVGLVLTLSGASAMLHLPVAVAVGLAACALLALRRELEAATLAVIVAVSPLLATMTTARIGDGTLLRIGAAGPQVAWAAPVAGVCAALTLGAMAHRRSSRAVAGAGAVALIGNLVAGLAVGAAAGSTWVSLGLVSLIAIELVASLTVDGFWSTLAKRVSDVVAPPAVIFGFVTLPIIVIHADYGRSWALTLALAASAAAYISMRRETSEPILADIASANVVGFAAACASAFAAASLTVSGLMAVGLVWCLVSSSRTRVLTAAMAAGISAYTLLVRSVGRGLSGVHRSLTLPVALDAILTIAVGVAVVALIVRRPRTPTLAAVGVIFATGVLMALVTWRMSPIWAQFLALGAMAAVGCFAVVRRPHMTHPIALLIAVVAATQMDNRWHGVAAVLISGSVTLLGSRCSHQLGFLWSPQLVAAALIALQTVGTSPNRVVGMLLVAGIAMTGIAFSTTRLTALDSGGLAAVMGAALVSHGFGVHPAFISLVVITMASQGLAYGMAKRWNELSVTCGLLGAGGVISLWFTSGVNAAALTWLARYDFSGVDLIVLIVASVLLMIGKWLRGWQHVSSWLAYAPGLVLLNASMLIAQGQRNADWATICGLGVGVVAVAVGGWNRLAAPLVLGTASLAATIIIASGSQLASLPGWTWMVVGGSLLLGLAALIERKTNADPTAGGGLRTMLKTFD